jgi:hypothetical protein
MDDLRAAAIARLGISVEETGAAWSWRLVTPDGAHVAGCAPNARAARHSAAFAAGVVSALNRTRQRRF